MPTPLGARGLSNKLWPLEPELNGSDSHTPGVKQFTHAPREDHVASRYLVELQKVFVIVVVEGPIRVDLRHVHRIADDAVRARGMRPSL